MNRITMKMILRYVIISLSWSSIFPLSPTFHVIKYLNILLLLRSHRSWYSSKIPFCFFFETIYSSPPECWMIGVLTSNWRFLEWGELLLFKLSKLIFEVIYYTRFPPLPPPPPPVTPAALADSLLDDIFGLDSWENILREIECCIYRVLSFTSLSSTWLVRLMSPGRALAFEDSFIGVSKIVYRIQIYNDKWARESK